MTKDSDTLKTGTTTLGLVCKDGIVLAADRRVTAGTLIANKKFTKIQEINGKMAVTIAGTVSDVQLLVKLLKAEIRLKSIRTAKDVDVKSSANLLAGMVYSNIRKMSMIPGVSHFLFGGTDNKGFELYDIYPDGSVTQVDDFVASGSGSVFVFGVLETQYKLGMSIDEGVELAETAIRAALRRDSASGNGIDVIAITKEGMQKKVSKVI